MLEETLRTVMRKLKEAYPEFMIVAEADKMTKNKDCFFVEVNYSVNTYSNKYMNKREITVSITHVPAKKSDRRKMNNIAENLSTIFNRFINIKDRNLLINNTKAQILKDSFGYYLVYSIQIPYLEGVLGLKKYENMEDVTIHPSRPSKPSEPDSEAEVMEEIKFGINYKNKERN